MTREETEQMLWTREFGNALDRPQLGDPRTHADNALKAFREAFPSARQLMRTGDVGAVGPRIGDIPLDLYNAWAKASPEDRAEFRKQYVR